MVRLHSSLRNLPTQLSAVPSSENSSSSRILPTLLPITKQTVKRLYNMAGCGAARVLIVLIKLYQKILSHDHSLLRHFYPYGFCPHEVTCSEYAIEQLRSQPLPKALSKIVTRIFHCNPWTKPSDDRLRHAVSRMIAEHR